jgi:hypothetical protein
MDKVRTAPIALFGPVSYYHSLLEAPFILNSKEVFVKQTFRSRFDILGPNGKLTLSIPVKKVNGSKTKTEEIEIDDSQDWRSQHLRSLRTAYASAPYFEHYYFDIVNLYSVEYKKLLDVCQASFNTVMNWFDLGLEWDLKTVELQNCESMDFAQFKSKSFVTSPYYQVFFDRFNFVPDLSIIDLVMNEGPMGRKYLV